jgi:multidrug efflux pump
MNITDICIRKPVFAWMIMAATVLFGAVALSRIGISQFPDVDFPTINVSATWEGAAPDVMESEVIQELEEAVMQAEGVRSVTSSARQGGANVTVELDIDRDVDTALQDVQAKVAQAQRRLPEDLDPPIVSKNNPEDQPILWLGVSGPYPRQVLADVAKYRVKERLQTVPGVGEVTVGGSMERNVRVWIDADKLAQHALTVGEVIAALQREHIELPAGTIETAGREVQVRVMGEALDLATLRRIVVRQTDGAPVRVEDVALVEDGFEDERRRARALGYPVQGLGVRKQRGANAVAVAQGVHAAMAEVNETLPEGMVIGVNFDSASFIEEAVDDIEHELIIAVILTGIVCWMFLGSLSSTLNVVLAIPMSLLGTVAVIWALGFTLNTFTLLALSLAVGIVVDDAIMVMENVYRHAEMGKHRVRAAREGTAEITFAALAATIAVVAIFLPVIFMPGVIGKFFLQFGVTLSVAVLFSYVEAVTLAPARLAQMLKAGRQERGLVGGFIDRGFERMSHGYRWLLGRSLRLPALVLVVGVASLGAAVVGFRALPSEMVPSQDQSRLMLRVITQVGSDLDETDAVFKQAEEFLNSQPEITRTMAIVGGFGGTINTVMVFVTLVPPDQRSESQAQIAQRIRKRLNAIPGMRAVVQDPSQQGFTAQRGFPIELSVRGPDWDTLVAQAKEVQDRLAQSGLAIDVDSDYELGAPELRVTPDRERAADLGVPMDELAGAISALVGGQRIGKYSSAGRRVDVRVKLMKAQRSKPEDIGSLYLRAASGALVPLSSLVTLEERPALQSITRRDRERAITIYGNVAPGHSQQEALAYVEDLGRELPQGYRVVLSGQSVAFQESIAGLLFAFLMGIAVAYMVLASQFNSFLHPVTVLTILPLSLVGAVFALLFAGQTLNIFSMIGLLLLAGIVKKNSIILVEYANHAADRGATAVDAMLEAGPTRLRPILMTSIATMMAAVPAALGLGAGSETRMPMAIAVIGGLVVSTLLSLFVVPAFYVMADWAKRKLGMGKDKGLGRLGDDDPEAGGEGGRGGPGPDDDGKPPLTYSV